MVNDNKALFDQPWRLTNIAVYIKKQEQCQTSAANVHIPISPESIAYTGIKYAVVTGLFIQAYKT